METQTPLKATPATSMALPHSTLGQRARLSASPSLSVPPMGNAAASYFRGELLSATTPGISLMPRPERFSVSSSTSQVIECPQLDCGHLNPLWNKFCSICHALLIKIPDSQGFSHAMQSVGACPSRMDRAAVGLPPIEAPVVAESSQHDLGLPQELELLYLAQMTGDSVLVIVTRDLVPLPSTVSDACEYAFLGLFTISAMEVSSLLLNRAGNGF